MKDPNNTDAQKAPGQRITVETAIDRILSGETKVVSHGSASQYRGGTVSACGLAALNCARILLSTERDGVRDRDLLRFILKRNTAEEIVSICAGWESTSHLEVEDIFSVPLFSRTLKLVASRFDQPNFEQFKTLLSELERSCPEGQSAAVVITRPPEIITCFKMANSTTTLYLLFDSHPRPKHPKGAGFTFTSSIDEAAKNLANLLCVDKRIFTESGMQWQAQLLASFSGHVFIAAPKADTTQELTQIVQDSSLKILALRAEVEDLKLQNTSLTEDSKRLRESSKQKQRSGGTNFVPPTSPQRRFEFDTPRANTSSTQPQQSPGSNGKQRTSRSPMRAVVYHSGDPIPTSALVHDDEDFAFATQVQLNWVDPPKSSTQTVTKRFSDEDRRLAREQMELELYEQETFSCTVCLDTHPEDDVAHVSGCKHAFCRDCLRSYVVSKITDHRFPVFCPVCVADQAADPGTVTDSLAQELGIPEESFLIWEELQLSAFSILMHCRKCKRSAFVDRSEYQESKIIACPLPGCNYAWCKSCHQGIEIGGPQHSCDGSSELEHLMTTQGWKHCPGCRTPIQKDSGCNHMTCMSPNCNTHFCYVCGESIIKSALAGAIKRAVSTHYSRCALFEH